MVNLMKENIFNKIAKKKVNIDYIYKDKYITVFNDINPKAPIHIIIIPNIYIKNLNYVNKKNIIYINKMFLYIPIITKKKNINKSGYRIIINCNKDSGQEIKYLHLHILGGCLLI